MIVRGNGKGPPHGVKGRGLVISIIEREDSKRLKDLDYADDICPLANKMDAMKTMTELDVEEASKKAWKSTQGRHKL